MRSLLTAIVLLGLVLSAHAADPKTVRPAPPKPPKEEELKIKPEELRAPEEVPDRSIIGRPPVELLVFPGEAKATPNRQGVSWANGGVIDVAQPNPTTIVVTMSGITATNAALLCDSVSSYHFDLTQCIGVRFNSKYVKTAHLSLESRVIGILRTNHRLYVGYVFKNIGGTSETEPATATVSAGQHELVTLSVPGQSTSCGQDQSVYSQEGPLCVPVTAGKYTLHESWGFGTTHPPFCERGASAEFSALPQFSLNPTAAYWFQHFQPYNGAATRDFGYRVTIKVVPD